MGLLLVGCRSDIREGRVLPRRLERVRQFRYTPSLGLEVVASVGQRGLEIRFDRAPLTEPGLGLRESCAGLGDTDVRLCDARFSVGHTGLRVLHLSFEVSTLFLVALEGLLDLTFELATVFL